MAEFPPLLVTKFSLFHKLVIGNQSTALIYILKKQLVYAPPSKSEQHPREEQQRRLHRVCNRLSGEAFSILGVDLRIKFDP